MQVHCFHDIEESTGYEIYHLQILNKVKSEVEFHLYSDEFFKGSYLKVCSQQRFSQGADEFMKFAVGNPLQKKPRSKWQSLAFPCAAAPQLLTLLMGSIGFSVERSSYLKVSTVILTKSG